jgi:predicted O-methyltransferase YrrM
MSVLPTLYDAYARRGFTLLSGLQPHRYGGLRQAAFTWLIKDGRSVTDGYGIALSEVQLLEALLPAIAPERIFIIGNSYGFSTLAIALICPQATVVTIDAGVDAHSRDGLELTEAIAKDLGLDGVKALLARSPENVGSVVEEHLGGGIDFAFIDGLHTNEQIVLDSEAVKPFTTAASVLLFHDVLEFGLEPGLNKAAAAYQTSAHILHATVSGLGLICPKPSESLQRAMVPFCPDEQTLAVPRAMIDWQREQRKGRAGRKLARSIRKRLGLTVEKRPTFHSGSLKSD